MRGIRKYYSAAILLVFLLVLIPAEGSALQPGLYIPDLFQGVVYKLNPVDNSVSVFYPASGTLNGPFFLEQDAAGNLIISVQLGGTVIRVAPGGTLIGTIATGLTRNHGMAYDSRGNLYVAELGTYCTGGPCPVGTIQRITPAGVRQTLVTGQNPLVDLEFDAEGNLYTTVVGDYYDPVGPPVGTGQLLRIARQDLESFSGTPITPVVIVSGIDWPVGLEYREGRMYFSEYRNNRIMYLNLVPPSVQTYFSPVQTPIGLAFDENRNLYVSQGSQVSRINDAATSITVVATGFGDAGGIVYAAPAATPPPPPAPLPRIVFISNNPSNWLDKNEYIARVDLASAAVKYYPATYNYYTNKDGWANPDGMTFMGNRLFITGFIPGTGMPRGIWELDPVSMQEVAYFPTTLGRDLGLATDGTNLYVSHYYGSKYTILRYTTAGRLLSTLKVPALMTGLAYGRSYLFCASKNKIYRINAANGQVAASFTVPFTNIQGLEYVDGARPYLIASVSFANVIYRIDLDENLNYAGTTSKLAAIPAGYNNAVVVILENAPDPVAPAVNAANATNSVTPAVNTAVR